MENRNYLGRGYQAHLGAQGPGTENRNDPGSAYQAHLVLKALPSIIAGFLLPGEERHLQFLLWLCPGAQMVSAEKG